MPTSTPFILRRLLVAAAVCLFTTPLSAQNVGIGVAAPLERLHVSAGIRSNALAGVGNGLVLTTDLGTLYRLSFTGNATDVLTGAETWAPASSVGGWLLTGNAGTNPATNFIGTIDARDWQIRTSNTNRVRVTAGGLVGIGTTAPGALLHLEDLYVPGGRNLLVGDQAYFTDIDVNNALGIYGNQNTDRLYMQMGSGGGWISGLGGGIGIANFATFNPGAQLHLADIYAPGGLNLLVGDNAYLTDIDVNNSVGIYGYPTPDSAFIQLGSTGGFISGYNGRIGISTVPFQPQAQLHLQDIYAAGGPNLLIGDQGFLTDVDIDNTIGIRGNQNTDRIYIQYGSTGGWVAGISGGIGISTTYTGFLPGAQLHLEDAYLPGGRNLLIGDQAYLTDLDVNNALGIFGNQNTDRAYVQLGNSAAWLSGLGGGIGIANFATFNPGAQLHLADIYAPGGINLLVGDNAYLTDIDQNNTLGIYGHDSPDNAYLLLGTGGSYISGENGMLGVSNVHGFIPEALLHLADIYAAGGKNLLIGDQGFITDLDVDNALGFRGNQNTDRMYLQMGSTGGVITGIGGGIGISTGFAFLPGALLHLEDAYAPGGRNLLIGDQAYLSDVDVNNTLGIYGNQNTDRIYLRLGSSGPTLAGLNGRLGINVAGPAYALELPNIAGPDGQGRANAWVTYSSGRWKQNIQTVQNPIEMLMALRGVTYTWKSDAQNNLDYGFIAEEVARVAPELVSMDASGQYAEGLDYARLLPILVESLKTQQQVIEDREREVAALKARLAQLEQLVEERLSTTPAQR